MKKALRQWHSLALAACCLPGTAISAPADGEKLRVVATHSIVAEWVEQVGGDAIELTALVQPGSDPHSFIPLPGDGIALAKADIIFKSGLGFEPWLDSLYAASASKAKRVVLSAGLKRLRAGAVRREPTGPLPPCCAGKAAKEISPVAPAEQRQTAKTPATPQQQEAGGDTQTQAEWDPHVWLDVKHAISAVILITDVLAETRPADAEDFDTRAARYRNRLEALDQWIVEQLAALPQGKRKMLTEHNSFTYFAHRYGLESPVSMFQSTHLEEAAPATSAVLSLVERLKADGAGAFFADAPEPSRLARSVAGEAGVKLAVLYADALSPPGGPAASYEQLMRHNVETVVKGLSE